MLKPLNIKVTLALTFGVCVLAGLLYLLSNYPSLDKVHTKIAKKFSNVAHITIADTNKLTHNHTQNHTQNKVLFFDVREQDEFDVSHINKAIHVLPSLSEEAFIKQYGNIIEGKTLIFYCSVGYRSSQFINDNKYLKNRDATFNLQGGVFNWVNKKQPLNNPKVHPYNTFWKQFINKKALISY